MGENADVNAGQGGKPVYDSYGRLSRVPETGELEKIETQHADNARVIERLGAVLGESLDDGLSAWRKGVRRPGWEKLLERVKSGQSDGIVVWHTDRLFRQPRDLETLIELADKGFRVGSAHGARDLSDADDRFILRIEVAHAARSSDDTQRRIKRRFDTLRRRGVAHAGPRPFGFPGLEPKTTGQAAEDRREVPAQRVKAERRAIADAASAVLAGVPLMTIAQEWNAAGLATVRGRTWTASTVREVLLRARNAGLIEHDGEIVSRMEGEPIIKDATFERVRALFASRRRGRVAGKRYVASGIVLCGREGCGKPLSGRPHNGVYRETGEKRRQYHCSKARRGCGKVAADVRAVDQQLKEFVISRLSDSRFAAAISAARSQVAERLGELDTEIAECQRVQQAIADRLGRREMSLEAYDAASAPLTRDLARLQAERDALSGGQPEGPTVAQSAEAIAEQWKAADTGDRRAMLVKALGRHKLYLDPATKTGKRTFNRNRLRVAEPSGRTV